MRTENNYKEYKKHIALGSGALIVALAILVVFFVLDTDKMDEEEMLDNPPSDEISLFENINIEASSAVVWDSSLEKAIYEKNPQAQLPLASLTKVIVAKIAVDNIPSGREIKITLEDLSEEGDSGFIDGESWTLKDLIDFTLIESSNDGSKALASAAASIGGDDDIASLLNDEARLLGLSQTYFLNPTGLDKNLGTSGAYGSAMDMVILFDKILDKNPSFLEATAYPILNINEHSAENTNYLTEKLPGIIASKTGFTDLAGGNLVMAYEVGPMRRIIIAVIGSSLEGRFGDMERLYLTTLREIAK